MKLIVAVDDLNAEMALLHGVGSVALVATMGALHDGHMALIKQAKQQADAVVVSIYVNPRQFGVGEDYHDYPRLLAQDRVRCADAGVDVLFVPSSLYDVDGPQVSLVVEPSLSDCLCGGSRSGHFDGVATVVAILFNLLRPDVALFGEKDWQQLQVIRALVADLYFPLRVVGVATQREPSGLAMSSRNLNLTPQGMKRAANVYAMLCAMQQHVRAGQCRVEVLAAAARERLLQDEIAIEYLQVRRGDSLCRVDTVDAGCRVFVAVRIDGVRLIDNMELGLG